MSDLLEELENLEVISRVIIELKNHLNIDDKDLAEYVIHIGLAEPDKQKFKEKLIEDGLSASDSLIESLFTLINVSKKPKSEKKKIETEVVPNEDAHKSLLEDRSKRFPGLALPNIPEREELKIERPSEYKAPSKHAMSLLNLENQIDDRLGNSKRYYKSNYKDDSRFFRERSRGRTRRSSETKDDEHFSTNKSHSRLKSRSSRNIEKKSSASLSDIEQNDFPTSKMNKQKLNDSRHHTHNYSRREINNRQLSDAEKHSKDFPTPYSSNLPVKERRQYSSAIEEDASLISDSRPNALNISEMYEGFVSKILQFGVLVKFEKNGISYQGIIHRNDLVKDVEINDKVYVKIQSINNNRISLICTTKDEYLNRSIAPYEDKKRYYPLCRSSSDSSFRSSSESSSSSLTNKKEFGTLTGIPLVSKSFRKYGDNLLSQQLIMSDIEKWELQQVAHSGTVSMDQALPVATMEELYDAEDIEIEVNDVEPLFLKGQTSRTGAQLSPIRVVANPDGTLPRAAATASALAKERREAREHTKSSSITNTENSDSENVLRPQFENQTSKYDPASYLSAALSSTDANNSNDIIQYYTSFIKTKKPGSLFKFSKDKTIKEQRESLPVFALKKDLIEAVRLNQILIVIGETGSGKTTQITQYLSEVGYTKKGVIGCTQPRRVAAISVAKRVAEEHGCRLGQDVGYCIRFEDCTSPQTIIKYMTDGMLLRESLVDPLLNRYSVIMLDEAHERTVSTDVLFGLLKETCRKRPDFKLIVTSATLDAEKFSSYFFNSHIFTIPGRTFPVEILYSKEPEVDHIEASLVTVLQIHLCERPGDILLFLTGQEEIDTACMLLHQRMQKLESMHPPPLIILPIYSALPSETQSMIFDPAPLGCRKCIVATNIAEASLTIDGIYFVIDPGFAKIKMYNPKTGMDSLLIVPISQANARQRAGRAGRTGAGKCYRLYTENAYNNEMLPTAIPEIQRTNLANTVLLLKALGVNDLINFDFMDPPPLQALVNAMEHLYQLGALDDEGLMTRLGRKMAEFPMDPALSKMLLASIDLKCSDEAITVVAMLQVQNVFYRPKDRQEHADRKKSKFHQAEGDHITYLQVYKQWQQNRFSNRWCHENYIQVRALRRVQDVRKQLILIMDRYKFKIMSCKKDYMSVCRCICSGFFRNACNKDSDKGYRTIIDNQKVYMHPSSALYQRAPEWTVYSELMMTTKEYIRDCCIIEPQWLTELAPHLYKVADKNEVSKRKQKEKIEPLFNRYEEPNSWRLSRRKGYAHI